MADEFAAPVKGIVKALEAGIRLAGRVLNAAASIREDQEQALLIPPSARNVKKVLEENRLVIADTYKQENEKSAGAFAVALDQNGRSNARQIIAAGGRPARADRRMPGLRRESSVFRDSSLREDPASVAEAQAARKNLDVAPLFTTARRTSVSAPMSPGTVASYLRDPSLSPETSGNMVEDTLLANDGLHHQRTSSPGQDGLQEHLRDMAPPPKQLSPQDVLPLRIISKNPVNDQMSLDADLAMRRVERMMHQMEVGADIEESEADDMLGEDTMFGYNSSSSPLDRNSSIASGSSFNDFVTKRSQFGSQGTKSSRGSSSLRSKAESEESYGPAARSFDHDSRYSIFENDEASFQAIHSGRKTSSIVSPLTPSFQFGVEDGPQAVAIPDGIQVVTEFHDAPEVVTADRENFPQLIEEESPAVRSYSSSTAVPQAAFARSTEIPMRHDTSFYKLGGFCEGAKAMIRGNAGFKVHRKPSGHLGTVSSVKCVKCLYEVVWNNVERDRLLDRAGIYENSGIRWRQKFVSKCHVRSLSSEEPLYACLFCAEESSTVEEHDATVFFSVPALFRHLAKHSRPLAKVSGISTLYGTQRESVLDFDIHFPTDEPIMHTYSMPEIVDDVQARAAGLAIVTYNPKVGNKFFKDPDDNGTLHFAEGARIVGISFPDNFNGQWYSGYHDGERGTFPAHAIALEFPSQEENLPKGTGVAIARWDFKPKDSKEGWLKFNKADKITSVSFATEDQWFWSGCNPKGKWGIFPAAFVEALKDEGRASSVPASRSFSLKARIGNFPMSRNKSTRQERVSTSRSDGTEERTCFQEGLDKIHRSDSAERRAKAAIKAEKSLKENLERDGVL